MAGRISVCFQREPSWFDAAVVDGFQRQVVACRDTETGRIIGYGCRSIRRLHVNGQPASVGYLSSLRLLPEYRNRGLIARGYAFFRKLHEDGQTPFYLTTIARDNRMAVEVLTSGRAGLPTYHPAGWYHTLAIPLPRRSGAAPKAGPVEVRAASVETLGCLVEFLNREGKRRQFFPCWREEDFFNPQGLLRDLAPERILQAWRGGKLVGCIAGWDQHAFRQSVIHSYAGWVALSRPLYNVWAWVRGLPGLPVAGTTLRYLTAALVVVAEDDPEVFVGLLEALRRQAAGGPWSYLLLGLHERDPLLRTAWRFQTTCYSAGLYLVCWPAGEAQRAALDDRPPYLELGSL